MKIASIRSLLPCLVLFAAGSASFVAIAGKGTASVNQQLESRADAFFPGPGNPGGVVLVHKDGQVLLRKAYGLADVENGVAMKPESVLRLASASKQFTAAAILQLVGSGKLGLDQPIAAIDKSLPATLGQVTLRQLLTHTSGIKNISSIAESRAARRQEASAESLMGFFRDLPLEFAPGSRFKYSNSNYIVLTRIIELSTGKRYAQHMQQAIFGPLGMADTAVGDHLTLVPNRAQGYQRRDGQLMNADFISMSQPQGAGALLSTVDDLAKWDRALNGDALVPRKLLAQAFQNARLNDGTAQPYGFGWMFANVQGERSAEHGGFINGFNSYVLRMPQHGVFVTVLTNAEFLPADDFAEELAAIAIGKTFDKTPPRAVATGWVGRYQFGSEDFKQVSLVDGRLQADLGDGEPIELKAAADGRFYLGDSLDYLRFDTGSEGVASMTVHNRFMGESIGRRTATPTGSTTP